MAPLTKEEKKAIKEAKKLEKLRQLIELQKQLRRDQLKREIKAQGQMREKLDENWKNIMLKIKEPIFKKDIEVMWQTFERVYDKKDHLIQYTLKLMNIADDQFQRTVSGFCNTIDTMINKFLSDTEELSRKNDLKTKELLLGGENETDNIRKDQTVAETHLQLLIYHEYVTSDEQSWNIRGENIVKEEEEASTFANIREDLRSFLEDAYNNMWNEFKVVLKNYVVATSENQKKSKILRLKEATISQMIAAQGKKIANSDGLLRRLRMELATYESGAKAAAFRDRRDRHRAACKRLKRNLTNGCLADEKQMELLVQKSNEAINWLEAALAKAEKILRMAELCRRFETRREKVLPYDLVQPHHVPRVKHPRKVSEDSIVIKAIASTAGLTKLWQRVSKAELSRRALSREKALLEAENEWIIKNYSMSNDSLSSTQETISTCPCNLKPSKTAVGPPTAIDGIIEVMKIRKPNQYY